MGSTAYPRMEVPRLAWAGAWAWSGAIALLVACGPRSISTADTAPAAASTPGDADADAVPLAATPPMGWNSWDAFGCAVTETDVRANADYMAKNLAAAGWSYVVVDVRWYESETTAFDIDRPVEVSLDGWGRLLPDPDVFPSASDGRGFTTLATWIHDRGLKFGVHIMRGIPRAAVERDTPILGTEYHASEVADRTSTCAWNPDMYGLDMSHPGAQAYLDSVYALLATWGVDYVKVDDLSYPYNDAEIEGVRRAIDRTGRPMVFSTSPGNTPLDRAEHVAAHAQLWRTTGDIWDDWSSFRRQADACRDWAPLARPGAWPDADMIALGAVRAGHGGWTRFRADEQVALMSLLSICRSPLMFGGHLPRSDDFTRDLLTNPEVLAVNQDSRASREVVRGDGLMWWTADAGTGGHHVAVFNLEPPEWIDPARALFVTPPLGPGDEPLALDVALPADAQGITLAALPEGDGHAIPVAWRDPTLVRGGNAVAMHELPFVHERSDSRYDPHVQRWRGSDPDGRAELRCRATCLANYELPAGTRRFRSKVSLLEGWGGVDPGARVRFAVYTGDPLDRPEKPTRTVSIGLDELGVVRPVTARDLWARRDLGPVRDALTLDVPWHGARLVHLAPAGAP